MKKYAIKVTNGDRTYVLGMYLGNVVVDEQIDYFKDYHPTLGQAITFDSEELAETVMNALSENMHTDRFEVIEVDSSDIALRVRYQYWQFQTII